MMAMTQQLKRLVSLAGALALVLALVPAYALATTPESMQAQEEVTIPASGTWGTCPWDIDVEGTLTVHPGVGADTKEEGSQWGASPWEDYGKLGLIKKIVFAQEGDSKVIAPAHSNALLRLSGTIDGVKVTPESIDLSGLDTSQVIDMSWMFSGVEYTSLDLSGFNTENVTSMEAMFAGCRMTVLDLSSFDTKNVTNMGMMFYCDYELETIYVSELWNTDKVTVSYDMWVDDKSLVGGNGTLSGYFAGDANGRSYFSEEGFNNVGAARIDTAETPGYLTYKAQASADPSDDSAPGVVPTEGTMHRLYNPNSGEHFYTSNEGEKDNLVSLGWDYEGEGWKAPASGAEVFRLYNAAGGEHHYTTNAAEKDALVGLGWDYEGVGWYSESEDGIGLMRLYNPNAFANNHHYTTDGNEKAYLISIGWQDEGIGWYGVK